MEVNVAQLRPAQILQRMKEMPVVFIPLGPLEWHGPHMPYGTDPIDAQFIAHEVCQRTGGVVWPTLYWGTERERTAPQLKSLGFREDQYVVGMDFPNHSMKSCYCPEEVLCIVMRETLRQARDVLGAKVAIITNGHGAENHMAAMRRLAIEFSNIGDLKVYFRLTFPRDLIANNSCDHASAAETSLMMHMTQVVDMAQLPKLPARLKYQDFGMVDGPGFDGGGPADKCLSDKADPRLEASAAWGKRLADQVIVEMQEEVMEVVRSTRNVNAR